jgi:hypothetical protein
MTELLRNAGPLGFLIVAAGGLVVTVSLATIAAALSPRTVRATLALAVVALGLGASTLLLGVVGSILERRATFRAAENVVQAQRDRLIAKGLEEASANLALGSMFGVPGLIVGAVALAVARKRRRGAA